MWSFAGFNPLFSIVGFIDIFAVSLVTSMFYKQCRFLNADDLQTGIIGSIYGTIQLFSCPIVGGMADKHGTKHVLVIGILITAASYICGGFSNALIFLALSRVFPGTFKHVQTLSRGILAKNLSPKQRASGFAMFNASGTLAYVISPPIVGHVLSNMKLVDAFKLLGLAAGALFLLNFLIIHLWYPNEEKDKAKTQQEDKPVVESEPSFIESAKFVFKDPNFVKIFLAKLFISGASILHRGSFGQLVEGKFSRSTTDYGFLLSFTSAVTVAMAPMVNVIICDLFYYNYGHTMACCCFLSTVGYLLISFSTQFWGIALGACFTAVASPVSRAALASLLLQVSDDGRHTSQLLGFDASALSFSRIVMPLLTGFILQYSELDVPSFLASGFAALAGCLILSLKANTRIISRYNNFDSKKID